MVSSAVRAFIAIEIPASIQVKLHEVSRNLKGRISGGAVRWTPVENIHLTLKFLGDVSPASMEMVKKLLAAETARHGEFEIQVSGLGAFPNTRRPRVIWIGIQAPDDLIILQRRIEEDAARLGYPAEERGFTPHLTLGRVARNAAIGDLRQIGEAIEAAKVGLLGASRVQAVKLFRSDLRPSGAVYSCLFAASLRR
ncbi:MAG: RNA 2',3'-cyclic phosphodiesterase [Chloroflexi bacterium]|nr:RNA 2',3'-cyclic phosphodiesterase [Chloroflexota bacterium]